MSRENEPRYVLLNGKFVPPNEIDPAKHKFIGMFRPAVDPAAGATCNVLCWCGQIQKYVHEAQEHYMAGHWDSPQYVDIAP